MNIVKPGNKIIIIASKNPGKIKEFRRLLSEFPVKILAQPDSIDIEETGETFAENARLKALKIATLTGEWSLADDSGLCVNALAGAPGIYSARYANSDPERINRLLKELQLIDDRSAFFISALCIASPQQSILLEVEGRCQGLITNLPRGNYGFGYDPIFEEQSTGLTFAEMEASQKEKLGHRGRAFSSLKPGLRNLLNLAG